MPATKCLPSSTPPVCLEPDLASSPPKTKKRVNFALSPTKIAEVSSPKTPVTTPIQCKSILKNRDEAVSSSPISSSTNISFGLDSYPSFAAMLQAMCYTLGTNDQHTKLDIYLTLNSAIKGLRIYPDSNVLIEQTPVLVTYIKRDIEFPSDGLEGCESRVMIQALKLFSFLASVDQLIPLIDPQVASWVLNLSVSVLENPDSRKNLLSSHLSFLASQRLPAPRIFTHDLASRILSALTQVYTRSKGIEGHCYHIFDTLLDLAPGIMLSRASEWVPLALKASFSESSAMHTKAIEPLRTSSRIFFETPAFNRAVLESFNLKEVGTEGRTVFDVCYSHIDDLLTNKHDDHLVVLWETVVVLLHSWGVRPYEKIHKWPEFNKWLELFRQCGNSTDVAVRSRAILAWQKLAFAWLNGHTIGRRSEMVQTRMDILLTIFKFFRDSRTDTKNALSLTFAKMAYLILRPGLSTPKVSCAAFSLRQSEFAWNQLVIPVIRDNCLRNSSTFAVGAHMLQKLLSPKAVAPKSDIELCFGTVTLNDVPGLNPKWIRSNTTVVLETVTKLFNKIASQKDCELALGVWNALLKNLQSLTQREVQQSAESTEAITAICNFLKVHFQSDAMEPKMFSILLVSAIEVFGIMIFTESKFVADDHDNFVIRSSSPSLRRMMIQRYSNPLEKGAALFFFLHLMIGRLERADKKEQLEASLNRVIQHSIASFPSRRKSLSFMSILMQISDGIVSWAIIKPHCIKLLHEGNEDEPGIEQELRSSLVSAVLKNESDKELAELAADCFGSESDGLMFAEVVQSLMTKYFESAEYLVIDTTICMIMGNFVRAASKAPNERAMTCIEMCLSTVFQLAMLDGIRSARVYETALELMNVISYEWFLVIVTVYYRHCGSWLANGMDPSGLVSDFHLDVCRLLFSRAMPSDLLLEEIRPLVVSYLKSSKPQLATVALNALGRLCASDGLDARADLFDLRVAIREASDAMHGERPDQMDHEPGNAEKPLKRESEGQSVGCVNSAHSVQAVENEAGPVEMAVDSTITESGMAQSSPESMQGITAAAEGGTGEADEVVKEQGMSKTDEVETNVDTVETEPEEQSAEMSGPGNDRADSVASSEPSERSDLAGSVSMTAPVPGQGAAVRSAKRGRPKKKAEEVSDCIVVRPERAHKRQIEEDAEAPRTPKKQRTESAEDTDEDEVQSSSPSVSGTNTERYRLNGQDSGGQCLDGGGHGRKRRRRRGAGRSLVSGFLGRVEGIERDCEGVADKMSADERREIEGALVRMLGTLYKCK